MSVPAAEVAQKDARRKLTKVVRILEDRYGPHIYPEDLGPLEQIVFALLAANNPVTNARKAIRDLKDEYVDWNEARVATVRQLEETLERARIEPAARHAEVLKDLLQKVFDEVCRVSLDGLRTDGPEKARKTVSKLEILEAHEQQYLLVGAGVEEGPPLDPATDRICARIGLFQPEDPPAKRRKLLESVVTGPDALRFHHLMVEHGKKLCTEEDPYPARCVRCPAQGECDFYKASELRARREEKERAQKRKDAPKAPKPEKVDRPAKAEKKPAAKAAAKAAKPTPKKAKAGRRRTGDEDE